MAYEVTMPILSHPTTHPVTVEELEKMWRDMILADRKFFADHYRRALDLPLGVTDDMIFEMVRRYGEEMADEDGE